MRSPIAALLTSAALAASLLAAAPAWADDAPPPSAPPVADTSAPAVPADPEPLIDFPAIPNPTIAKSDGIPPKLTASVDLTGVPAGYTLKWTWLRDGNAISGATAASYTVTESDRLHTLSARATVTKSGYAPKSVTSDGFDDFFLTLNPAFAFTGGAMVGDVYGVTHLDFTKPDGSPVDLSSLTYQWKRNGAAIAGATSATHQATGADYGAAISLYAVAKSPGYLVASVGALADSPGLAIMTVGNPTISGPVARVLTASMQAGSITDPHPELGPYTLSYRWFRNLAAIPGATQPTYTLTAADIGTTTTVTVVVSKLGYYHYDTSASGDFTMKPNAPFVLDADSTPHIGTTLSVPNPGFTFGGMSADPDLNYLWMRDGVKITTASTTTGAYTITAADSGHAVSVRVTAPDPYGNAPTYVWTSSTTQKIGLFAFTPNGSVGVAASGAPATLSVTSLGVTRVSGMKIAYQWMRDGHPITGATKSTYKLAVADYGTLTTVRLTFTAPSFTPYVATSDPTSYTLQADSIPGIAGGSTAKVGDSLTAVVPNYTTPTGGHPTPMLAFQWLRNGVAIAGETNASYIVRSGDKGAKISLKIVATWPGLNQAPGTSMQTPPVAFGLMSVAPIQPVVGIGAHALHASLLGGTVSTPQVTLKYQWYRNGVAVKGATTADYVLTSLDKGKPITVRVIVTKANVLPPSVTLPISNPTVWDIKVTDAGTGDLIPIFGDGKVGGQVYVGSGWAWEYVSGGSASVASTKYQWYRQNGPTGTPVAIPGATSSTYVQGVADLGKYLRVKLSVTGPGIVPFAVYSGAAGPVALGQTTSYGTPILTMNSSTNVITASMQAGSLQPATPAPVYHYTWYHRPAGGGASVQIGTGATHKLAIQDYGYDLWVRIQVDRDGYEYGFGRSYTIDSTYYNYDLHQSGTTGLTSSPKYNVPITGALPTFLDSGNNTPLSTPKWRFTWFRLSQPDYFGKVTVIAGATKQTYTPTDADIGSYLGFSAAPTYPGYLNTGPGTPISGVVTGSSLGWNGVVPTIVTSDTSLKLTASRTGIAFTVAPTSLAYQWQRQLDPGGPWTSISGATASTYTMTTADRGYNVRLVITYKKVGYTRVVAVSSNVVNRTFAATGPGSISGTPQTDQTLTLNLPTTTTFVSGAYYVIQWYRYDAVHGTSTKITGATKVSYKVTPTDAEHSYQLYAKLTPTRAGWLGVTTSSAFSAAAARASINYSASGITTSNHTMRSTLVVSTAGVKVTHQWWKDGHKIAGATGSTYTPSNPNSLPGDWTLVETLSKAGYNTIQLQSTYHYT